MAIAKSLFTCNWWRHKPKAMVDLYATGGLPTRKDPFVIAYTVGPITKRKVWKNNQMWTVPRFLVWKWFQIPASDSS
eukprot:1157489-Pelagomonas_calceolata.AAC.1